MSEMTEPTQKSTSPSEQPRAGLDFNSTRTRVAAGAVVLAVVVGIVVWVIVGGGGSSSTSPNVTPIAPIALSASGLKTLARTVPQPVYWAGPQSGRLYELSRTSNGNVYIRYLPPGVKAGAPAAKYLAIATYPLKNALQVLNANANGNGVSIPHGGIAIVDPKNPKDVRLAYPGVAYLLEIYDPSGNARSIAVSGGVRPVSG